MGRVPRRFVVASTVLLAATFSSSIAGAQTTALFLDSQPGDPVGGGLTQTLTPPDFTFFPSQSPGNARFALVRGDATIWSFRFGAPAGAALTPGVYEDAAQGFFSSDVTAQLVVTKVNGGGDCASAPGRFIVYEFAVDSNGGVTRFAADFERHCSGMTSALFGAIRFNSTRSSLVPFDGAYPVYSLSIDAAAHGYVTGPGIDCGAGQTDCAETYEADTAVALHAEPSPGYVFLGWAGDCVGDEDAAVVMKRRRFCTPVFNAAPETANVESPDYSQEAVFLDGVFGLPDGGPLVEQGTKRVFVSLPAGSPMRSIVKPVSRFIPNFGTIPNSSKLVQFQVEGPLATVVNLLFAAPAGTPLGPGDYSYASGVYDPMTSVPLLQLSGTGLVCASGGRFRVHEYSFDGNSGSVIAFAADFELPCGTSGALLSGSIRYRAARKSVLPFEGTYPVYALRVVSSLGGYVTSTGIDCGDGGRTDCDETYTSPTTVSLLAVPAAEYELAAWVGHCPGNAAMTTVVVDRSKRCFAVFMPMPNSGAMWDPSFGLGTVFLEELTSSSSPLRRVWLGVDAVVQLTRIAPNLDLVSTSSGATARIHFSGYDSLVTGDVEENIESGPVSILGCSSLSRSRIYELTRDASGNIISFAADFEALCDRTTNRRVVGAVRINSMRHSLLPFDGAYPIYKLKIAPASNGIVTAAGINCGAARTDCAETFGTAGTVTLDASPLPGYRFLGWSDACEGPSTTTVAVKWIHTCRAFFTPVIPAPGPDDELFKDAAVMIHSQSGDPLGLGVRKIWVNAGISAKSFFSTPDSVSVDLPDSWTVSFIAPNGEPLRPGSYENAVYPGFSSAAPPAPTRPRILVTRAGHRCQTTNAVGRFVIYEISLPVTPFPESLPVAPLAVDFEVQCTPGGPSLRGSIRLDSTRTVLAPFAPAVFTPAPMPARSDFDGDGMPDLAWRHAVSGGNAVWMMDGVNRRFGALLSPSGAASVPDLDWEIRAVADMNDDDRPDLIWQHRTLGRIAVWFMSGTTRLGTNYLFDATHSSTEPDLDWKIVAAGDMDRDGHTDLLWRHRSSGEIRLWHMNGLVKWDSVTIATVPDAGWEIVDLADMNADGMLDFVWRHAGSGRIAVWFMVDAVLQATSPFSPAALSDMNWRICGVVDMNGDGKPDLVWQNMATGGLGVWFMNGVSMMSGIRLNPASVSDPNWRIVGVR